MIDTNKRHVARFWSLGLTAGLAGALIGPGTARAHDVAEVAAEMRTAAQRFLAALDADQRARATFEFADAERLNWHFIPRRRRGLPIRDMNAGQRHLAHGLLASALSHRGYLEATTIMSLEQVLRELEQGRGPERDPALYFVSVFGQPAADAPWGWRMEGHHLSINLTLTPEGGLRATPSFFGSNPAEVREGRRKGLRAQAFEEDLGFELVNSLSGTERRQAIISGRAPRDVIAGPGRKAALLEPPGVAAADLSAEQRALLGRLLRSYLERHRPAIAKEAWARIEEAGLSRVHFAWAGATQPGKGHYYRAQGPTFILEFDNTQNQANHIHSVWREFHGDFGEDVLRQHYAESHAGR